MDVAGVFERPASATIRTTITRPMNTVTVTILRRIGAGALTSAPQRVPPRPMTLSVDDAESG